MGYLIRLILLFVCLIAIITTNFSWKNGIFVAVILLIITNQFRETFKLVNEKPEGEYFLVMKKSKSSLWIFNLIYAILSYISYRKGHQFSGYMFVFFVAMSIMLIINSFILIKYKFAPYVLETTRIIKNSTIKSIYLTELLYAIRLNGFSNKISFHFQGEKEFSIHLNEYEEDAIIEFINRIREKSKNTVEISENLEGFLMKKNTLVSP